MNKKVICFGEVLWDILPEGPRIGGAPLNVCYHLKQHGIKSQIVSQVGDDALGKQILSQMNTWGLDSTYCTSTADYATSVVEVGLNAEGKASYTIVENVAWDFIPFDPKVAEAIQNADAFIFGSLAARNDFTLRTLQQYLERSKFAVMDINLRSPYFQAEVIFDLLQWTDCLKINDEEILLLAKWLKLPHTDEVNCVKAIMGEFPRIKSVILTKGDQGAEYYLIDQKLSVAAYAIDVKDTIGAGDAFLACFLALQLQNKAIHESLESAALLSAFVATKAGACPSYTLNELQHFKSKHTKHEDF